MEYYQLRTCGLLFYRPGHEVVGKIHVKQLYEIAKIKHADVDHLDLEQVARCITGSCASMGIEVVNEPLEAVGEA